MCLLRFYFVLVCVVLLEYEKYVCGGVYLFVILNYLWLMKYVYDELKV